MVQSARNIITNWHFLPDIGSSAPEPQGVTGALPPFGGGLNDIASAADIDALNGVVTAVNDIANGAIDAGVPALNDILDPVVWLG